MTDDELQGLIEMARLAGQPDPADWAADWIEIPHPKLGGRLPKDSFTSRSGLLYVYAIAAVEAEFPRVESQANALPATTPAPG